MSKKMFFWNGNEKETCGEFVDSIAEDLAFADSFEEIRLLPQLTDLKIDDLLYVFDAGADLRTARMLKFHVENDLISICGERPNINLLVLILNAKPEDHWEEFFAILKQILGSEVGEFDEILYPPDPLQKASELNHRGSLDEVSPQSQTPEKERKIFSEDTVQEDAELKRRWADLKSTYTAIKSLCENKRFWHGKVLGGASLPKGMARIYKIAKDESNYAGSEGLINMAEIAKSRLEVVPKLFEPSTWFRGIRAKETQEIYEAIARLTNPTPETRLDVRQHLGKIQAPGAGIGNQNTAPGA